MAANNKERNYFVIAIKKLWIQFCPPLKVNILNLSVFNMALSVIITVAHLPKLKLFSIYVANYKTGLLKAGALWVGNGSQRAGNVLSALLLIGSWIIVQWTLTNQGALLTRKSHLAANLVPRVHRVFNEQMVARLVSGTIGKKGYWLFVLLSLRAVVDLNSTICGITNAIIPEFLQVTNC